MDLTSFADRWLAEWDSEEWGEATDFMHEAVRENPELAWSLIERLVEAAPNDDSLDMIGAGPLEDLLCDHGPDLNDRAEHVALSDPRFRRSLAAVWGWSAMDPRVRTRLDDALRVEQ
jgi:hypothetical protein